MVDRRLLSVILAVCLCWMALPSAVFAGAGSGSTAERIVALPTAECVQLTWYAAQLQGAGFDDEADDDEDLSTWTAADYDAEIALYDSYLAQLDAIEPPPAAQAFHQTIRDALSLYQEALGTMKTQGPFAILAYLDQFDALDKQAAALALPLEEECGITLYNSDDAELDTDTSVATPDEDEMPQAETVSPVTTRDGRPVMPIGTQVQTNDAFALTVISVDQNAVDAVPDPAPDGYQYVNVEIKLSHMREQSDTFDLISLVAVGGNGPVYSAVGNSCGVVDGPLAPGNYSGSVSMTGHVCFVVASRDVAGLILFDQTQPSEQRVYLSLDPEMGG